VKKLVELFIDNLKRMLKDQRDYLKFNIGIFIAVSFSLIIFLLSFTPNLSLSIVIGLFSFTLSTIFLFELLGFLIRLKVSKDQKTQEEYRPLIRRLGISHFLYNIGIFAFFIGIYFIFLHFRIFLLIILLAIYLLYNAIQLVYYSIVAYVKIFKINKLKRNLKNESNIQSLSRLNYFFHGLHIITGFSFLGLGIYIIISTFLFFEVLTLTLV
jgi:hypothetical protein